MLSGYSFPEYIPELGSVRVFSSEDYLMDFIKYRNSTAKELHLTKSTYEKLLKEDIIVRSRQ